MSVESKRIVVAMSGGVDSSVAVALLAQKGYEVIGVMLRLWSDDICETESRCCSPESMAQAHRVSAILDIPFHVVDAKQLFFDNVVEPWIRDYEFNSTPNPGLSCNRMIRWDFLLDRALVLGAQYLATGHYARIHQSGDGVFQLLKAVDEQKDQSYVLHVMDQYRLGHALFPLGELTKSEVRQIARQAKLPGPARR